MRDHRLLFDVGNTTIGVGLSRHTAQGPRLLHAWSLPSGGLMTADSLGLQLRGLLEAASVEPGWPSWLDRLDWAMACSVAPALDPLLRQACQRMLGVETRFAHAEIPVPLENRYARPMEVGADRIMAAWTASRLFPGPCHIVVDFGTATTLDCVREGAYLGGLICPGVLSSARALSSQTAKLPQITLDVDGDVLHIGRSTKESLNQGLVFGFASMIDGLVARLSPLVTCQGSRPLVVAAGGLASTIAPRAACFHQVRPDLILEGLALLALEHD